MQFLFFLLALTNEIINDRSSFYASTKSKFGISIFHSFIGEKNEYNQK